MANHCFLHFKKSVTLEEVEDAIRFYCEKRLGLKDKVYRTKDVIHVKLPGFFDYPLEASYWLKDAKTLEHRHIMDRDWQLSTKIFDFIGWSLKATHKTDEGVSEKINPHFFLSHPAILPDGYEHELKSSKIVEEAHKIYQNLFHEHKNLFKKEKQHVKAINQLAAFWYPAPEDKALLEKPYWKSMSEAFEKRLVQIEELIKDTSFKDYNTQDFAYGDILRAALSNSNYKLAGWLIDKGVPVNDKIDFKNVSKPGYVSKDFLEKINMPLLHIAFIAIEENIRSECVYNITKKLLQSGANPYLKDSRGLNAIEIFLYNKTPTKKQHEAILKAFVENLDNEELLENINNATIDFAKKEQYKSKIEELKQKISHEIKLEKSTHLKLM